jgi:CRP/FNR family transcriptional regulator
MQSMAHPAGSREPRGVLAMCANQTLERFSSRGVSRALAAGEALFRRGERRTHLYLVEAGTIALYCRLPGAHDGAHHGSAKEGAQEVVEFTFPGDVLGFGLRAHHAYSAAALAASRVRLLPLAPGEEALPGGERNKRRYRQAIDREFHALRAERVAASRGDPLRRLAAFLLAISELNRHEGRDARLITDSLRCRSVATCLDIDLAALAEALLTLQRLGLIANSPPSALRLTDLEGLQALAAAAPAAAP